MDEALEIIKRYRKISRRQAKLDSSDDDKTSTVGFRRATEDDAATRSSDERFHTSEDENESRFNSSLTTLLAENTWRMVATKSGKYRVKFKSSLSYRERINILEIVLEDIRERYIDLRMELQRMRRKYAKKKRKRLEEQ